MYSIPVTVMIVNKYLDYVFRTKGLPLSLVLRRYDYILLQTCSTSGNCRTSSAHLSELLICEKGVGVHSYNVELSDYGHQNIAKCNYQPQVFNDWKACKLLRSSVLLCTSRWPHHTVFRPKQRTLKEHR